MSVVAWVLFLLVCLVRPAMASTYCAVHKEQEVYDERLAVISGYNAHTLVHVDIDRAEGEDPKLHLQMKFTSWGTGNGMDNTVWSGYRLTVGGDLVGFAQSFNGRTGWVGYSAVDVMPGFRTVTIQIQVYYVVTNAVSYTLDLSESWLSDPNTGNPTVVPPQAPPDPGSNASWWSWLTGLFTPSADAKSNLAAAIETLRQSGPWGEVSALEYDLSDRRWEGVGEVPGPGSMFMSVRGCPGLGPVGTGPVWLLGSDSFPGLGDGEVGYCSYDGLSPFGTWAGAAPHTLYGYRERFVRFLVYAMWLMFGVGILAWLKGRLVV